MSSSRVENWRATEIISVRFQLPPRQTQRLRFPELRLSCQFLLKVYVTYWSGSAFMHGSTLSCNHCISLRYNRAKHYSTCFKPKPKPPCLLKTKAFRYIFLLKFLQTYGRLYHLVPASLWLKDLPTIGLLCSLRHYPGSSLLQAHPPPSYHKHTSQRLLVIGLACSKPFFLGQGGLL